MRAILSKLVIGTFVSGAALAVSACGDKTETTTDNTLVTDMNMTDDMGTMTDNMTAVHGPLGNDAALATAAALVNDAAATAAAAHTAHPNAKAMYSPRSPRPTPRSPLPTKGPAERPAIDRTSRRETSGQSGAILGGAV